MVGRVVCVFGTASDVGKSVTAAALGRMLANKGLRVAPFKAQNMSNNAGVVRVSEGGGGGDGEVMGEIGRAQVVQAEACRVAPETDMNPVLLKPSSDRASQVVLHGKALGHADAAELWKKGGSAQSPLRVASYASLRRLVGRYDVVVVEGAGSCAEVNLRDRDYVNFDVAHEAARLAAEDGSPPPIVLIVADIEKGGVFAQVTGTLGCMREADRALVSGFLVNKFRGDASLFDDGVTWLEEQTGLPILGVVPYFDPLDVAGDGTRWVLDAEDGLYAHARVDPCELKGGGHGVRVAVLLLPRISNHTDFAPLQAHPGMTLDFLRTPRDLGVYDMVILPGSKSVVADLKWLLETGWQPHLIQFTHKPKGVLMGVCGGYQMLGASICDAGGHDGAATDAQQRGLGLLPVHTTMTSTKTLKQVEGAAWAAGVLFPDGTRVGGYEIHVGATERVGATQEGDVAEVLRKADGAPDGCVWTRPGTASTVLGTYLHGVFDGDAGDHIVAAVTGVAPPAAPRAAAAGDRFDAVARHYEAALSKPSAKDIFKWAEPSA
eukprot:TRINITY_DN32427_c0_g1_i1.p1 TRINITY_DN32427_c0_g1~~TRINITY_DN32427_c0_g1_i1.p1  ORF type:complete len:548 (+),score=222.08 TRINITY_DN32427_c0_g1_i1:62-1705(+)